MVADPTPGVEGDAVAVGHLHGEARARPEGADVVRRAVPVVPAEPVAADAAVHEARVAGDGRLGLQVELVERVRPEVADEDVGRREEVFEALPVDGLAQVEDHAALAPVVERERGVGEVVADAERSEDVTHGVAGRWLDLDHLRAPVREQRGRRGRRYPHAQLHDPQVVERGEIAGVGRCHVDDTRARSSSLSTFPVALTGSSSTISTTRGTL